jgi:hypothetical protein
MTALLENADGTLFTNTPEIRAGVLKIVNIVFDAKSSELKKVWVVSLWTHLLQYVLLQQAEILIYTMFNLNSSEFSTVQQTMSKNEQRIVTDILQQSKQIGDSHLNARRSANNSYVFNVS